MEVPIHLPPAVVNAPQPGAVVTVREVKELDLSAVRTILASEEMSEYLREIAEAQIVEAHAMQYWRNNEGPRRAQELWACGERVINRAGTATMEALQSKKRARKWRMQYQRNP